MREVTPKQELFCLAYVGPAQGNATKAYRMAEYGDQKHAGKRSYDLMQKEHIKARIEELLAEKKRTFFLQEADILEGLYNEALGKAGDSTQSGRIAAWAWLGKHLKMFQEKQQTSIGEANFTIVSYADNNHGPKEKIIEAAASLPQPVVEEIKEATLLEYDGDTIEITDFPEETQ